MRTYSSGLKIASCVTLAFFLWSFGPLFQVVAFAADKRQGQGTSNRGQGIQDQGHGSGGKGQGIQNQGPGERFEKAIEDIREKVGRAGERSRKGEEPVAEIQFIKAKKSEIEALDAELKSEFAATEKKLKDAKLPHEILSRHANFVEHYENNLKELIANLEQVERAQTKAEVDATVKKTKGHLEKVKPPRRHKQLDPNKLPHRTVKAKEKAPRLKREDFERDFPKKKHKNLATDSHRLAQIFEAASFNSATRNPHSALTGKPVLLAFNDFVSDIPLSLGAQSLTPQFAFSESSPFLLAQQTVDLPTPADLAETVEVQFTPEIRAKAQELGGNPVKIYEWVRNSIEYVPTYGSIQGADMCLQTKQCNDIDTASLLIALLRTSNISARYVYGTIEVPIDKIKNWVGGFSDATAALTLVGSGGIPVAAGISGGTITKAQLEHVWVEGWIDYIPSRGAVQRQGNTWIPLDASFKQYTYKTGLDVQQITGFDPSAFTNSLINSGVTDTTTGSTTGINTALIQTQIDAAKTSLEIYINTLQNPTVGDVIGSKDIITQQLELLPASLPYKTILTGAKYAEIPDSLRYKVGVSIYDPQTMTQSMNATFSTAYLAGKRITLAYMPATETDGQTLQAYGYYNVKPYMVNLRPVLYIEGVPVVSGLSVGMGEMQDLSVSFAAADGSTDRVTHSVPASTYASIGLDLQSITKGLIDQRTAKLTAAKDLSPTQNINVDDVIGEILNLHNLGYFYQVEATNRAAARGAVTYSKQPAEMLATLKPSISYLYGIPYSVSGLGVGVDVKRYALSTVSLRGNDSDEIAFMKTSGAYSSAYEHIIIEELHQNAQAVSAVKIISIANQQGIPIYTIDSTNSAAILPRLQISSEAMADVQNALAAGKRITIPERSVQYYDWHGDGYIVMDPTTGAAAYMISGGLAGGGTATLGDQLSSFFEDILKNYAFDFTKAAITFIFKLGSGIAAKFADIAGGITIVLSAVTAGFDMYYKTGNNPYKGIAAGIVDVAISLIAAVYIGAILSAATGFMAAVVPILMVAMIATLIEMIILAAIQYSFIPLREQGKYPAKNVPLRRCSYAV